MLMRCSSLTPKLFLLAPGSSALPMPGQWSYRLGPCEGVALADELWISRYILLRVSEYFGLSVSFEPDPIPGCTHTLSCHVEFSTSETRSPGTGLQAIEAQVDRLRGSHMKHVIAYGRGYLRRLAAPSRTQLRQQSQEFTYSFGSKLSSIMIPHEVRIRKFGCYFDQRPASNMDPYLVTALLVSSALALPLPMPPVLRARADGGGPGGAGEPEGSVGEAQLAEGGMQEDEQFMAWEESFISELVMHESMIPDTPPPLHQAWNK